MKKITKPYLKLFILTLCAGAAVLLHYSGIGCFWRYFFGIKCPGCGMTSAYISLLKLDIVSAFRFHPMFWTLPIVLLYVLYDGKLFSNKVIDKSILIVIAIGFAVNYVIGLMR